MDPFTIAALVFTGVNMIFGGINGAASVDAQNQQLAKQKAQEQQMRDMVLADMDLNFKTDKDEANKNADKADKQSTFNEKMVSEDTNNQIDALKIRQEKEAADFNSMAVQIGQAEGNALTQNAGSGTRTGGSVAQSIDLQKAMNMSQLQLEEDATRNSDKIGLASILYNLANNVNGIQNDRTAAYDLRQAFEEGGSQYNIYKSKRDITETRYNQSIQNMQDQIDDNNANKFWYTLQGIFGGGRQGLQAAQSIGQLSSDLGLDKMFKSSSASSTGSNTTMNLGSYASNLYNTTRHQALGNGLGSVGKQLYKSTFNSLWG